MSADIVDISLISAADSSFAAAGVVSGETMSPTIAKTASNRLMSRQKSIVQPHIGSWTCEDGSHHKFATTMGRERASDDVNLIKGTALTSDIPAQEAHKCLTARGPEKNDLIPFGRAAFHSG
ncbi:hypothetical protein [Afipia broomeae]|jgi:hypothetical protein|uniref:hypothetical protein n=1 Tax=Afipia broomeae TaxID=56946 RepID=UPI0005A3010B|nr:hypothetical protein [Afipia broomeae]MCR6736717.1 hypothetical protein [Afipia sp.]